MKKYILTTLLSLMWITFALASSSAFEEAMLKQIQEKNKIKNSEDAQSVINGFMRIASANEAEWLPLYYAALTQTETAFRFDVNKDQYFDQALEITKQAQEISPSNSEITALNGYILMGKVSVDAGSRGQSLSPKVMELFGKAIAQDRSNPRAVSLMAQMELGMSKFFGSGPDKACGMARMSMELYQNEEAKITETYILPTWGKNQMVELMKNCN
jgi:hypothetical protein